MRLTSLQVAHVAYFGFFSETKEPKDYTKSLALLQVVETTLYLVSALVLYHFVGPDVKSPALSSAGPLMRKVCYGIAIPTVSLRQPYRKEAYLMFARSSSLV